MKLCLFDATPEATKLWQKLAVAHGLQLETFPAWRGVESIPDSTNVLIIDQSSLPAPWEAELLELCRQQPHLLVVATGEQLPVHSVVTLMRGGVSRLLEKPLDDGQLDRVLPEMLAAAAALHASREEFHKLSQLFSSLTIRERHVLECVLAGVPNKDTAQQLKISVRTVESRRAKVYSKLELKHVAELVRKMDRLEQLRAAFGTRSSSRFSASAPSLRSPARAPDANPQPPSQPPPRSEISSALDESA